MKYLPFCFFLLMPYTFWAQPIFIQWFDAPYDMHRSSFYIDTVNCDSNQWQIGRPQKNIFDVAYSAPNAIVTDTLHPYRANDTSVFYITSVGDYYGMLSIEFLYRLDIDTLSTVKVELSGDVGQNWINPMMEDDVYMFYWSGSKPRFDTPSGGWDTFALNMDMWSASTPGGWGPTFPHYRTSDTVLFRFTFMSGTDTAKHNGWMLDNFSVINTARMNVNPLRRHEAAWYPNPTKGTIYTKRKLVAENEEQMLIFDIHGRLVYRTTILDEGPINLPLPNGLYTLKYQGRSATEVSKLIIAR